MSITVMKSNRRLIKGWATVEVKDYQSDYIPIEVMKSAFLEYMSRGGAILFRHKGKIVGRVLHWNPEMNKESGKEGITIIAEINKQYKFDDLVWEAVQKGAIRGFSVGGDIPDPEKNVVAKEAGINEVQKVELGEISLVVDPANPYAMIEEKSVAKEEIKQPSPDIERLEQIYGKDRAHQIVEVIGEEDAFRLLKAKSGLFDKSTDKAEDASGFDPNGDKETPRKPSPADEEYVQDDNFQKKKKKTFEDYPGDTHDIGPDDMSKAMDMVTDLLVIESIDKTIKKNPKGGWDVVHCHAKKELEKGHYGKKGGHLVEINPDKSQKKIEEFGKDKEKGSVIGHHETYEQAMSQHRAIMANKTKELFDEVLKDKRPPKKWWDRAHRAISEVTDTPRRLTGWVWYHHKKKELEKMNKEGGEEDFDEFVQSGRARAKYGLETDSGSEYYALRQQGMSDAEAQKRIFRRRWEMEKENVQSMAKAYTDRNFRSKKELKEAVARGEQITVYQPNADLTGARIPENGTVYLEGPHYPEPHRWYAQAELKNGIVVKVKEMEKGAHSPEDTAWRKKIEEWRRQGYSDSEIKAMLSDETGGDLAGDVYERLFDDRYWGKEYMKGNQNGQTLRKDEEFSSLMKEFDTTLDAMRGLNGVLKVKSALKSFEKELKSLKKAMSMFPNAKLIRYREDIHDHCQNCDKETNKLYWYKLDERTTATFCPDCARALELPLEKEMNKGFGTNVICKYCGNKFDYSKGVTCPVCGFDMERWESSHAHGWGRDIQHAGIPSPGEFALGKERTPYPRMGQMMKMGMTKGDEWDKKIEEEKRLQGPARKRISEMAEYEDKEGGEEVRMQKKMFSDVDVPKGEIQEYRDKGYSDEEILETLVGQGMTWDDAKRAIRRNKERTPYAQIGSMMNMGVKKALVDDIIRFESGEMTDEEVIDMFQRLVDTGQVWGLQGSYGRTARALIEAGYVVEKEDMKKVNIGGDPMMTNTLPKPPKPEGPSEPSSKPTTAGEPAKTPKAEGEQPKLFKPGKPPSRIRQAVDFATGNW